MTWLLCFIGLSSVVGHLFSSLTREIVRIRRSSNVFIDGVTLSGSVLITAVN